MSDEARKSRRSVGDVTRVLLLIAMIAVAILLYQLSSKIGKLSRHGEEREHQQVVAAIADLMTETGVRPEELAPTSQPAAPSTRHPAGQEYTRRRGKLARAGQRRAVRSDNDYEFDPTYGMRSRSEIDRLRPKRMETGEEYRRMYEEGRRQASTPTRVTEWDVFAKDINRSVPTAEEFSAVLRGDRSIWATD